MVLKIDPEFEKLMTPLTEDEFQQLKENILTEGKILQPICIWNGVIVDGHNRYRIAQRHPHITFSVCEMEFEDRFCNGIFNHTSLCQFYQGRLLLHVTIPFEEKPTSNLPGDNLRYYRQRKSLTTRQLAEQIDVVSATILMYEQNKHPIPFDVANGLADVLDVNANLLYDDFALFLSTPYSEALKDIRTSIGMSQRAFAEHIGVIPSYYYKLESGHRRPSRKVYLRMVDTLTRTHPHHSLFAQHKLQSK